MDVTQYSIEQLKDALRHVDKEKFPERAELLEKTLQEKLDDGLSHVSSEDFKDNVKFIPSDEVFRVWSYFILTSTLVGIVVGYVIAIATGVVFTLIGAPAAYVKVAGYIANFAVGIYVSWIFFRIALARKYKNFEIVFMPRN